ncbi:Vacuolar protein sorting-associated protein 41 [Malassezia cuniculi]|uniref:Vacuolar protein sorting-associated protein 41 n=1 Tax=Malassezia cuniculi TaxID=948313 RepID=A0AAF0J5F0_9BASI|nr:Vacuolar protein sorting-associated protein 41 [Malassezia cuniculi]
MGNRKKRDARHKAQAKHTGSAQHAPTHSDSAHEGATGRENAHTHTQGAESQPPLPAEQLATATQSGADSADASHNAVTQAPDTDKAESEPGYLPPDTHAADNDKNADADETDAPDDAEDVSANVSTPGAPQASEHSVQHAADTHSAASDDQSQATDDASESLQVYEPMFRFERVHGTLGDVCARDTISALAVSTDRFAVGMHSGMIYVLHTDGSLERGFRFHSAAVNDLVFDTTGEFIGSAGLDGHVAIASLHASEQYVFDFRRPVRTIALEPNFGRRSSRAFVCGGMAGNLVYRDKRWFGHKETIIHSGEGPVIAAAWRARWIAWANDCGVRIADSNTQQVVSLIAAPPGADLGLARCSLEWRDDSTLVIAHGERITVASVRTQSADEPPPLANLFPGTAPKVYVEVTAIFQLDSVTCGLAHFKQDMLVLAHIPEHGHTELRTISAQGDELDSDALALDDSPRFRSSDYHLLGTYEHRIECTSQKKVLSPVFYAASPSQVLTVRPRDERDHIDFLLSNKNFAEALAYLDELGPAAAGMGVDVDAIGHAYLDHLISLGDYEGAAERLAPLLGDDVRSWETYIFLFVDHGHVPTVLPYIPLSQPQLSEVLYEMVLVSLLRDPVLLCDTLRRWPVHIYSTPAVAAALEDQCAGENSEVLTEALAHLYLANHQPARALQYFLVLGRPIVLDLLAEHNLFPAVRDRLSDLIRLEVKLAGTDQPPRSLLIDLLVANMHSVPIKRVVAQLKDASWYEYKYLDALCARDPQLVSEYGGTLVRLYAQYDYAKLLPFLRVLNVEWFSEAYKVCKEHDYVPEMVFILGRTGDNQGALSLILERLGDVYRAIDFVKQQDDPELWTRLLEHSQDRPEFIRALLEHVGGEIDPLHILRRIRNGLAVPGLKYALMKILHNFHLQVSLLQGCSSVLNHAARDAGEHLERAQSSGLYCQLDTICAVCYGAISRSHALVFLCGHAAHAMCLAPDMPLGTSARQTVYTVHETETQRRAHSSARWIGMCDEAAPLARDVPDVPPERALSHSLFLERRLRRQPFAQQGCPACFSRNSYCLA